MTTTETDDPSGRATLGHGGDRRGVALARLVIGFLQGIGLWWLYRAETGGAGAGVWPATEPRLFGPLLLVVGYLPIVLLAGVGRLRGRTLAIWGVVAGVILALLALHDIVRASSDNDAPFGALSLLPFSAVALFIGHHLILPADRERRLIAPFPAYFDAAWMAGVQLALSIGFTGTFWLLLFLGAALFDVIGLKFLSDLIREPSFALPLTGVVFATAVHLTDVRDGLIRGVRTVALMLLSWLLLVLTVLVTGFLAALPFTGLEGLWRTGNATALVLAAAGGLIILINTAYQDGRADNLPPMALRVAVRVASVLLTPLIVIAFWGLALRIGQHGLTPDRIIAVACALVGTAYAAGYGWAALIPIVRRDRPWMKALELTNIVTAVVTVAVILALFSPLADPARLSVSDQVARLERGAVTADQFDYRFLRFESGKAGETALARLAISSDTGVASRAREAQKADNRYDLAEPPAASDLSITMVPTGTGLPRSFSDDPPSSEFGRVCLNPGDCVGRLNDLDGDGRDELLVAQQFSIDVFVLGDDGRWSRAGNYWMRRRCSEAERRIDGRDVLRRDRVDPASPRWPDLASGAPTNWTFQTEDGCERSDR